MDKQNLKTKIVSSTWKGLVLHWRNQGGNAYLSFLRYDYISPVDWV